MGLFTKDTDFFGLDIGSSGIRLVQLRREAGHPALVAYGHAAVTGNITMSDAKIDQDKVAEMVSQLVRENHITTKNVVAGIPSAKIFATVITTPKIDDNQLGKAIRYQAEQYIPMAIDQVKLDYTVLDTSPDGKSLEVLLVAAPNSIIDKYVTILEKAGLDPLALEANALASARALVPADGGAVLIIDVASLDSDISIVYRNAPRLLRSVGVGSLTLVKAVAQNLGLDDVQASQFIYKFGLTQDKLEGQVLKSLKPALNNLMSEIDRSVKYFNGRYPDVKLERLVLTGAATSIPEFGAFLANSTGLPVEFGNAWLNVGYPNGLQDKLMGLSSEYAASVGLAERGLI